MARVTYRPTPRSFLPAIFKSLAMTSIATGFWFGYAHRPGLKELVAASLFTLIAVVFVVMPALYVARQRVTVGPHGILCGTRFFSVRIFWRDIRRVEILEKYRTYSGTKRTDRLARISSELHSVACSPSSWPSGDEEQFLRTLEERSAEYGFPILRRTTRI